jgi:5-methylcytosine-specific restriction enzyme A
MTKKIPRVSPLVPKFDRKWGADHSPPAVNFYHSVPSRRWRDAVKARAGHRCEAIEDGKRCTVSAPDRLYADHIHEIEDGGDRYALTNGQCLCHGHHERKTALMKRDRARE